MPRDATVGIILFAYLALHTPPLPGADRYLAGVVAQLLAANHVCSARAPNPRAGQERLQGTSHRGAFCVQWQVGVANPTRSNPGILAALPSLERTASPPEAGSPFGSALLRLMS